MYAACYVCPIVTKIEESFQISVGMLKHEMWQVLLRRDEDGGQFLTDLLDELKKDKEELTEKGWNQN